MPPKKSPAVKKPPSKPSNDDTPMSLPQLLKVLTSNNGKHAAALTMSQAMQAAAKLVPKGYTSMAKLTRLTMQDLATTVGIEDAEVRKRIVALSSSSSSPSSTNTAPRPYKRPRRDQDLDSPLPSPATKRQHQQQQAQVAQDLDFDEIQAQETLKLKSVVTNRAPVMTAWATIVAERLGFSRQEALSIAQVYTDMNASSKGVSIGVLDKSRLEPGGGPSQPFVELMGRKVPVMSTRTGEWRAMAHGQTADPQQAFSYIQRNFRQQMGAVMGALRILATSFSPNELNEVGYSLYCDFRPTVQQWGEKGEMKLVDVLGLQKTTTFEQDEFDQGTLGAEEGREVVQDTEGQGDSERDGLRVVKVEDGQGGTTTLTNLAVTTEFGSDEQDVKPDLTSTSNVATTSHTSQQQQHTPELKRDEFDDLLDDGDDEAFAALDV
ncbi:hypothetical protein ACM66B_002552 [Microbotryomycetes sp. NB124-2]